MQSLIYCISTIIQFKTFLNSLVISSLNYEVLEMCGFIFKYLIISHFFLLFISHLILFCSENRLYHFNSFKSIETCYKATHMVYVGESSMHTWMCILQFGVVLNRLTISFKTYIFFLIFCVFFLLYFVWEDV